MSTAAGAPGTTLPQLVDAALAAHPDAVALIEVGDRPARLIWAELRAAADRVSTMLLDRGVRAGESVAFQLPNWAECAVVILGVLQIGAVVSPVMPVFGEREVALALSRSRARVLVVPQSFRGRRPFEELAAVAAEAARRDLPLHLEHVLVVADRDPSGAARAGTDEGRPPRSDAPRSSNESSNPSAGWSVTDFDAALAATDPAARDLAGPRPAPGDLAQLLFTSGTTGEPKGVQHRHGTLALATALEVDHLGLTAEDRVFIPSPLAHQTGFLYGLVLSWQLGTAAVVQPVWDARVALQQAFGEARARFVQAATPFLMDIVTAVEQHGAERPDSLRIFVATGAAVPRELGERAARVLGAAVCGAFGTTETCLGALAAPDDADGPAWSSDGRPLPGIRLRIVDDEGRELPADHEGHFELLSPTVFDGYLDRPDLTAEVFTADGWYRTGDLARLDPAGRLHITGRVKDVINRGGEKIPVVEIENLLFAHPAVADVAIVAMPDARLGERGCAFVVMSVGRGMLTFTEMQRCLAEAHVSKYYWPERLEIVPELPRNAVGKIQKNLLRERAATLEKESASE